MIRRKPPKPFSVPSWVVGRDFPDPNTRPPGTVPNDPTGLNESIIRPSPAPPPTAPAPPAALPPPAPPQSATPSAPPPAAETPLQQRPAPKPRNTRAAAESNLEPPTSNFHSGKCTICNHPERADIEAAFLNWQPAHQIVADFNLPSRTTIYRHAKAADLLNQRRKNLRSALDQIIEQAGRVPPTASGVLRAIELSCRLADGNIAPLKRYEVTHKYIHEPKADPSDCRAGGSHSPGVRPQSESNSQPPTSNVHKQSVHQNILADLNSLNPKEGHDKQSVHIRGT